MAREVVYLNLNWFVDECRDDFMKFSLVVDSSLNVCNSYAEQGRVKGFFTQLSSGMQAHLERFRQSN